MSRPRKSSLSWCKSSYSNPSEDCVEIARTPDSAFVRDSKNPGAGSLRFTTSTWHALLAHLEH